MDMVLARPHLSRDWGWWESLHHLTKQPQTQWLAEAPILIVCFTHIYPIDAIGTPLGRCIRCNLDIRAFTRWFLEQAPQGSLKGVIDDDEDGPPLVRFPINDGPIGVLGPSNKQDYEKNEPISVQHWLSIGYGTGIIC